MLPCLPCNTFALASTMKDTQYFLEMHNLELTFYRVQVVELTDWP